MGILRQLTTHEARQNWEICQYHTGEEKHIFRVSEAKLIFFFITLTNGNAVMGSTLPRSTDEGRL
jgi:hypothetical protein